MIMEMQLYITISFQV